MTPITRATKAHRPTARIGSVQPWRRMFHTSTAAAASEIQKRSSKAGSRAWTSVYPAPSTNPLVEVTSWYLASTYPAALASAIRASSTERWAFTTGRTRGRARWVRIPPFR